MNYFFRVLLFSFTVDCKFILNLKRFLIVYMMSIDSLGPDLDLVGFKLVVKPRC